MNIYWNPLIQRICQVAKELLRNHKSDGIAIVTAHVVMSYDNKPVFWIIKGAKIEPAKEKYKFLDLLSS